MNIVNRKVADKCINVVDAVSIGEEMALDFVKSLPDVFHNRLKNRVKTMETMKRGVVVGEKTVYDMEALFSQLLIVGQSRNINLATLFEYELCAVPPSIIDEFGILRNGSKAQLMKKLAIVSTEPSNSESWMQNSCCITSSGLVIQFIPSLRAWEPNCSPTTHSCV